MRLAGGSGKGNPTKSKTLQSDSSSSGTGKSNSSGKSKQPNLGQVKNQTWTKTHVEELVSSALTLPKPAYTNVLGPDSKLTQKERDRQKKFNLCMLCGGKHKIEDCDKCKNSAKGRVAKLQESADPQASSDAAEN